MSGLFKTRSTFAALVSRGKFWDIFTPWKAEIDISNKIVTILKRNWHLISEDEDTFKFNSVRHISIDNYLFGADIHIKMFGGNASIYCIPKKDAKRIKELLFN